MPIAKLKRYKGNPRRNADAVAGVAASLKEFGWRQPIVVDKKLVIIAGDTRYLAAKLLGLETVPVHVAQDLTPEQVRAYRLADNKVGEKAEWDQGLLSAEIMGLAAAEFDLKPFGFTPAELKKAKQPAAGQTGADEPAPDMPAQYKILIECADEAHQLRLLKKFEKEKIDCSPVVV